MRIRAIVFTTVNAEDKPQLDQAWDHETAEEHTEAVNQALADVLVAGTVHDLGAAATHRAGLVDIEVPDDVLLQLLNRTVSGVVVVDGPRDNAG